MLRLSLKALESFKNLYRSEFGVDLSDEEANKLGVELLQFVSLIYKPIPIKDERSLKSWIDFPKGSCTLGGEEKIR